MEAPLNRGSNERAQMLAVDLIFVDAVQRLAHVVVEDTRWEGKEMLRLCFNRLVLRLHDVALSRALAWAVQRDDERALFRLANDAETSIVPAAAHRGPGRGGGMMAGGGEHTRGWGDAQRDEASAGARTYCVPYWSPSVMPSMRTRRPTSIARAAARLSRL